MGECCSRFTIRILPKCHFGGLLFTFHDRNFAKMSLLEEFCSRCTIGFLLKCQLRMNFVHVSLWCLRHGSEPTMPDAQKVGGCCFPDQLRARYELASDPNRSPDHANTSKSVIEGLEPCRRHHNAFLSCGSPSWRCSPSEGPKGRHCDPDFCDLQETFLQRIS